MIPDLQWLLLGLPIVFALGWMAARIDLRQLKRDQRDNPKAYFKGLSLLLNEQQDKAIDAFIEAVQHDPDTAELHFALGNLFRRRGEFERAVRVHEHLLSRADLRPEDRDRAQRALAQDFMRAGLFDRAEAAWSALEGTRFDGEARLALLSLHERSRDWARACEVATELERRGMGNFGQRLAHYHCERAVDADARGEPALAEIELTQAHQVAPGAARPLIMRGQRQAQQDQAWQAMQTWETLLAVAPASFGLVSSEYANAARIAQVQHAAALSSASGAATSATSNPLATARATLTKAYEQSASLAVLRALLSLEPDAEASRKRLLAHATQQPTLSAAQALLAQPMGAVSDASLDAVRAAVDRAARPLQRYRCAACGFEAQHWFWQCPGCLGWDSFPPQPIEEL
jgi:lipopolysaccharide biosynthesis regulator YciM